MQNFVSNILKFKISAEELAKKTGIDNIRVAEILHGNSEPQMREVRLIAKALNVRPEFLIAKDNSYQSVNALFRENVSQQIEPIYDKISYKITNAVNILKGIYAGQNIHAIFPKVGTDYQGAFEIASVFRQVYFNSDFISPISILPTIIAEKLNCVLMVSEIGNKIDGVSAIINEIPFIIISPRFLPRMFFTLAHELGHIIAHHADHTNFAIIDDYKIFNRKRGQERFAHAFASELLLPQEGVAILLKAVRKQFNLSGDYFGEIEIMYLSRFYGVSFEVAALRCENLGLIPQGSAISLYESLKKEYGGPEKRAAELQLPERPEISIPIISSNLMQPIINKINDGELSLGLAAELLSIPAADIITYNSQDGGYSLR